MIAGAQPGPPPFKIGCIYTGPDMESHHAELGLTLMTGATGLTSWTDLFPMSQWRAARLDPGLRNWHANPNPAMSILLSGRIETTLGGGVMRVTTAGSVGLSLDALGKGHLTNVIGPEPALVIAMMLSRDQVDELAKRASGWPRDIVLPPRA